MAPRTPKRKKKLSESQVEKIFICWIRGQSISDICKKHHITREEFAGYKIYKDDILKNFYTTIRTMLKEDFNSLEVARCLHIPLSQMNKIIISMQEESNDKIHTEAFKKFAQASKQYKKGRSDYNREDK